MPGVGTATGAKLLARKRPRLCPATDKVVIRAAGLPGQTWEVVRFMLQDPEARADLEALRPPDAAGASLLRLLDVAIWIVHSPAREAPAGPARPAAAARPDPARPERPGGLGWRGRSWAGAAAGSGAGAVSRRRPGPACP